MCEKGSLNGAGYAKTVAIFIEDLFVTARTKLGGPLLVADVCGGSNIARGPVREVGERSPLKCAKILRTRYLAIRSRVGAAKTKG